MNCAKCRFGTAQRCYFIALNGRPEKVKGALKAWIKKYAHGICEWFKAR